MSNVRPHTHASVIQSPQMLWLHNRWLLNMALPALVLSLLGAVLVSAATHYPYVIVSNRSDKCANDWFADFSPSRTAQLQTYAEALTRTSPVLLFCLGLHKLTAQGSDPALVDIKRAAAGGYAPAAEWLAFAHLDGTFVTHNFESGRRWLAYADRYGGDVARDTLYAFGIRGLSRDLAYGFGTLLCLVAVTALCKRSNGFDLRFLGPALLFYSLVGFAAIRRDKFLANDGSLEAAISFVVAAIGANLTAVAIRHDPSMPLDVR